MTIREKRDATPAINRAIQSITNILAEGDVLAKEIQNREAGFKQAITRLNTALTVGGDDGQILYNNIKADIDAKKKSLHEMLIKYGNNLEAL